MLNPTFPKSACRAVRSPYVLDGPMADATLLGNEAFDTGTEYRLQKVYGEEIWRKLERAGFSPSRLDGCHVLEVCAGTGFLTYHLLQRCRPKSLTVNDISPAEIKAAQRLITGVYPDEKISWVLGDMHKVGFHRDFDVIIGNSFLHHFPNVPLVLKRFATLLKAEGTLISLHEPTPMATVVEGAKILAYPVALLFPAFINDIARKKHKGQPSTTDIWMFESRALQKVAFKSGFVKARLINWNLLRPLLTKILGLHLKSEKQNLTNFEKRILKASIILDSYLNKLLPSRFFGSISLILEK